MTPQWFFASLDWVLKVLGARKPRPKIDSRSILIVEDNPHDAQLLLDCLDHYGLKATHTETAEGAETLIRLNHIRIAFVDMRLLHKPGWELVPLIRGISPETVIVVVCGELSDIANINEPFGAIFVMLKPASAETIGSLLKQLGIL